MSSTTAAPLVALVTDFGTADGYPGVLKGVILGIAPAARLVDLTHEIPPQDILAGAWVLHTAWRSFPEDTIFLCVVDPGVGSARCPLALRCASSSSPRPALACASAYCRVNRFDGAIVFTFQRCSRASRKSPMPSRARPSRSSASG